MIPGEGESVAQAILRGPFKEVAGTAAVYEIRLRMLADMRASTRHVMLERAIDVEDLLIAEYAIPPEDAGRLRMTRQLRNTILHGAFRDAKAKLVSLGGAVGTANVRMVELAKMPADAEALEAALAKAKAVAGEDGSDSIYGWLLECKATRFFERAAEAFEASMDILDRIRDLAAEAER